jgi:nucleoid DNA-binding protein
MVANVIGVLTNQFARAVQRACELNNAALKTIRRHMRSGEIVDVSGWGPFPQANRRARHPAFSHVVPFARH